MFWFALSHEVANYFLDVFSEVAGRWDLVKRLYEFEFHFIAKLMRNQLRMLFYLLLLALGSR